MPTVLRDVPYGQGKDAVADIHLPDGHANSGLMVNLHGGGWYTGDKSLATRCCAEFAARGFVVVNANYRILATDPVPAMVADALAVLRWTTSGSAPGAVRSAATSASDQPAAVLTGDSAGAHIALLSAQAMVSSKLALALGVEVAGLPRVRAVVSWSGALSLLKLRVGSFNEWADRFATYERAIAGDEADRLAQLDPVQWITDRIPPTLAFTSAFDFFQESTLDYVDAAMAAGLPVELVDFDASHPECVHSWQLDPAAGVAQSTYDLTTEFALAHP